MYGRTRGPYMGAHRDFDKAWMEPRQCKKCHSMVLMREKQIYCSKCQKMIGYGLDNKSGLSTRESEDKTAEG